MLIPHPGIRIESLSLSVSGDTVPILKAQEAEIRLFLPSALNETREVILFVPAATVSMTSAGTSQETFRRLFTETEAPPPPKREPSKPRVSKVEQEIESRSKALASGEFHPGTKPISRPQLLMPKPLPLIPVRHSVFEKVSLREIHILETSLDRFTMRGVEIHPRLHEWVLTGDADRGLFPWFSCPQPVSSRGLISLSISGAGINCSQSHVN
jgi:hypothetical protein